MHFPGTVSPGGTLRTDAMRDAVQPLRSLDLASNPIAGRKRVPSGGRRPLGGECTKRYIRRSVDRGWFPSFPALRLARCWDQSPSSSLFPFPCFTLARRGPSRTRRTLQFTQRGCFTPGGAEAARAVRVKVRGRRRQKKSSELYSSFCKSRSSFCFGYSPRRFGRIPDPWILLCGGRRREDGGARQRRPRRSWRPWHASPASARSRCASACCERDSNGAGS